MVRPMKKKAMTLSKKFSKQLKDHFYLLQDFFLNHTPKFGTGARADYMFGYESSYSHFLLFRLKKHRQHVRQI